MCGKIEKPLPSISTSSLLTAVINTLLVGGRYSTKGYDYGECPASTPMLNIGLKLFSQDERIVGHISLSIMGKHARYREDVTVEDTITGTTYKISDARSHDSPDLLTVSKMDPGQQFDSIDDVVKHVKKS